MFQCFHCNILCWKIIVTMKALKDFMNLLLTKDLLLRKLRMCLITFTDTDTDHFWMEYSILPAMSSLRI